MVRWERLASLSFHLSSIVNYSPLHVLNRLIIASERLHVDISIILDAVVLRESSAIGIDVRVTPGAICGIMHRSVRAASASLLRDKFLRRAQPTTSISWGIGLHGQEASAAKADICVSTSTICCVDLGSACVSQSTAHLSKF